MIPFSPYPPTTESTMDNNVSYMQLLASVGQKSTQQFGSFDSFQSPSLGYSTGWSPPKFPEAQMQYPTRISWPEDGNFTPDQYQNDVLREECYMVGESSGACTDSDHEELEAGNILEESCLDIGSDDGVQELPNDDGVLYDYDFPISDAERDDIDVHKISTIEDHIQEENTPWKKRKRHAKGVVLPNCRKSTGMGAVETAMRNSSTRSTPHIFQPSVGMTFDSAAEAHNFYNLYSWEIGFGIRYGKSHSNKVNDYRSMQEIECGNAGSDNRVQYQTIRCNCKAKIRLHRTEDHAWYICTMEDNHNHQMAVCCGEKMQWKSHRHIDEHTRGMIKNLRENNLTLTKVHGVLGSFFGSVKDLPFTKRSLRTVCSQISREQLDDDVKKTLDVFRKIRAEDPDFAFSVQVDQQNRIKTLIWTNHRSIMQYKCFGDALTFDTTYCTNIYKMPFGLFVGVNNHFQSVIYAGVLMKDETIPSFVWVFNEFISLMGGRHPLTILTDQAKAMEEALKVAMPRTTHLWCKWHVLNKAKESLGPVYTKNICFRQQFFKVINEMLTIDEFEKAWKDLITRYKLVKNPFMIRTYEARLKWAKPYSKDKFCARMMSTQRSESANHMLKTYVPRNSSMNRFVEMYNMLLYDRSVEEDREEHKTKQEKRRLKGGWPIQKHAYKIYTRASYNLFTEEFSKGSQYVVFQSDEENVYRVHHTNAEKRDAWARVDFRVRVLGGGQYYECECGLYKHFGILCCHAIRVLVHLGVGEIPDAHILKRWTKDARDVLPPHLAMYQKDNPSMKSTTFRHGLLYLLSLETVKIGNTDTETCKIVMIKMAEARKECSDSLAARGVSEIPATEVYDSSDGETDCFDPAGYRSAPEANARRGVLQKEKGSSNGISVKKLSKLKAPLIVRSAGRPRANRFLSPSETNKSGKKRPPSKKKHPKKPSTPGTQTSFCRICRESGHNSTTCEKRDFPLKPKKPSRCSSCNLMGHKANQCFTRIPSVEDLDMEI